MNICTKQFQLLTDIELVWKRMTGGGNEFYRKIGYTDQQSLLHFHK